MSPVATPGTLPFAAGMERLTMGHDGTMGPEHRVARPDGCSDTPTVGRKRYPQQGAHARPEATQSPCEWMSGPHHPPTLGQRRGHRPPSYRCWSVRGGQRNVSGAAGLRGAAVCLSPPAVATDGRRPQPWAAKDMGSSDSPRMSNGSPNQASA